MFQLLYSIYISWLRILSILESNLHNLLWNCCSVKTYFWTCYYNNNYAYHCFSIIRSSDFSESLATSCVPVNNSVRIYKTKCTNHIWSLIIILSMSTVCVWKSTPFEFVCVCVFEREREKEKERLEFVRQKSCWGRVKLLELTGTSSVLSYWLPAFLTLPNTHTDNHNHV